MEKLPTKITAIRQMTINVDIMVEEMLEESPDLKPEDITVEAIIERFAEWVDDDLNHAETFYLDQNGAEL
jgi:hypothetical protein